MGVSESLLTGTMEDGRRIAVCPCGQVVPQGLYSKSGG